MPYPILDVLKRKKGAAAKTQSWPLAFFHDTKVLSVRGQPRYLLSFAALLLYDKFCGSLRVVALS